MKAKGTVLSSSGGLSRIRVNHGEYCANCGLHDPSQTFVDFDAVDPIGVSVGDSVEVESQAKAMLPVVFLVFWTPLLLAALGAWFGHLIAQATAIDRVVIMSLASLLFFSTGVLGVYLFGKRIKAGTGLKIIRIVPEDEMAQRCDLHRDDPTHVCHHNEHSSEESAESADKQRS